MTFDATNLLNSYYQDHFGNQAVYPRDTRRFDQTYSLGCDSNCSGPPADMNWETRPRQSGPTLTRRSVLLASAGLAALPFRSAQRANA